MDNGFVSAVVMLVSGLAVQCLSYGTKTILPARTSWKSSWIPRIAIGASGLKATLTQSPAELSMNPPDMRQAAGPTSIAPFQATTPDHQSFATAGRHSQASAPRRGRAPASALSTGVCEFVGSIFAASLIGAWRYNFSRIKSTLRFMSVSIVLSIVGGSPAFAWGDLGHRTIAEVAEVRLHPRARAAVADLLGSSDLLATPNCPVGTLGDASVWADCVRSLYRPRFGSSAAWHYVDVPLCGRFDLAAPCRDGQCVTAQIVRWRAVLADRTLSRRARVEALMWVTHLVGDIHQPLHVADNGDRGGNSVPVEYEGGSARAHNLHALWDRDLAEIVIDGAGGMRAFARWAVTRRDPVLPGLVAAWAYGSWASARTVVYPSLPMPPTCGAGMVDAAERIDVIYVRRAGPVVRDQLALAGLRLGSVLNEALGQ